MYCLVDEINLKTFDFLRSNLKSKYNFANASNFSFSKFFREKHFFRKPQTQLIVEGEMQSSSRELNSWQKLINVMIALLGCPMDWFSFWGCPMKVYIC